MSEPIIIHPQRVAIREIVLPGPALIAQQIENLKKISREHPDYIAEGYLIIFEAAGYKYIREAFNAIKKTSILDVTEVEFWNTCISMGRYGFSTNVEIAELTNFSEQN